MKLELSKCKSFRLCFLLITFALLINGITSLDSAELNGKEAGLELLEERDEKTSQDSDNKLIEASEQEAIKEVIKNEIVNPENISITQKKISIANQINENLAQNSAVVIDNTKTTLVSDNKTNEIKPLNVSDKTNLFEEAIQTSQNAENSTYTFIDLVLDFIFIISLVIMGVSVILIIVIVSRKVKHADIDNQEELGHREVECPEPILIDECSVLDADNCYQNFKDYKNMKNFKRESNDYSNTTGENSCNNIYSLNHKNAFEYKKLDNDIDDFINEDENRMVGGKVYHKKDQFLII